MAKRKNGDSEIRKLERSVAAGGGPEACIRLLRLYERHDYDVLGGVVVWLVKQTSEDAPDPQTLAVCQTEEDAKNWALDEIYDIGVLDEVPDDREEAFQAYAEETGRVFSFEDVRIEDTPVVVRHPDDEPDEEDLDAIDEEE